MIDINPGILIAQIITFVIALSIVWKIAWGPLTTMMRQREENITRAIAQAEDERKAAEELRKSYEGHLAKSRVEAQQLIAQAAGEGQKERERLIAEARSDSEKLVTNARVQLADEKNRLVKELRSEVAELSVRISEKLIQKSIDKSVQDKVFNEMVDNLGAPSGEKPQ